MAINKNKVIALADKHIAKQNYAKALNELKKVVGESADDINLLNKMGDLYSKTHDIENAKNCFMRVASSYQSSGFALKAIAVYKKIIRLNDRFHDARDRLVQLYIQQGHVPEAKGELRRMAELHLGDNTPAKALACFEKMVEIDPTNIDARIKIADILVKQGRLDSAAEQYVHMGRDLIDKNMVNEAQKIISKGMRISSRNVDLRVLNARIQLQDGLADEAVKTLTEIIRQDPQHKEAIRTLGKLYLDRRQLKDALALFQKLFRLDPSETELLEEVGRKLIENDQLDQAFEALSPIADLFLRDKQHDDATRLYRSILYKDEDHPRAQEKLVEIYRSSGQTENAVLGLEKLIRQCLISDDPTTAIPYLEQVLELSPDNQEWKDKLVELGGVEPEPLEPDVDEEVEDNTDIHVFDDGDMDALPKQDLLSESGKHQSVASVAEISEGAADAETRIQNHLTESEFLIKYGMLDKAQEHLMAVKELDILNVKANTMLKDLFMRQGQIDMAVACQICLINVCIDEGQYDTARGIIEEIREQRPEVAEMQDERLANLAADGDGEPSPPASELSASDISEAGEPSGQIIFDQASQEVVDFQKLNEEKPHADIDALPESAIEEGWSLDMPESVLSGDGSTGAGGAAEDIRDLFQDDQADDLDGTGLDMPETGDSEVAPVTETEAPLAGDPVAGAPEVEPADAFDLPDDPFGDDASLLSAAELEPAVEPEAAAVEEAPVVEADDDEPLLSGDELEEPAAVEEPSAAAETTTDEPDIDDSGHAPLGSQQGSLGGELEEIDFFISVEAFEDARNLIEEARERFGEHPMLMERMQEVESKTQAAEAEAPAQPLPKPVTSEPAPASQGFDEPQGEDFFDLAAELNDELFEDAGDVNDNTSQEEIQSVEELFQEFKRGVEQQIDEDDHQTHYDLGIAYKEMGLLEEAIGEFEKAQRDGTRFLECVTMIGNCLIELGRTEDAIAHYQQSLQTDGLESESEKAIYYEIAQGYEGLGELELALEAFREIEKLDPGYRDLGERIEALV